MQKVSGRQLRGGLASLAGAGCLLLASCGGGDGSPTPTPTPPPSSTAPRFTSGASANVIENSSGTIYTVTATDPQNDPIAFDIYSGPDAGAFAIGADGALRFNSPPNYDLPTDANGDNVYQITLRATAGGEQATQNLAVRVMNDFEGIKVTRIATGLSDPVGMAPLFSDLKFVVAEKGGKVFEFDGATGDLTELASVESKMAPGQILDVGFYFDGNPYSEGILLLTYSASDGLLFQSINPQSGKTFSRQLAGTWSAPVQAALLVSNRTSDGGSILAAIGDPGGSAAQDASSGYGKLWEIIAGNPYLTASVSDDLIYQIGMIGDGIQAPDGGGILYNRTLLVDRGSTKAHEISLFDVYQRPIDFGWPFYEGAAAVRANPPAAVIGPSLVYEFGNGAKQGQGIVSGVGYAGDIQGIQSHYVFGDKNGKIWSILASKLNDGYLHDAKEIEDRTEDFAADQGKIDSPVAFAIAFQQIFILDSDGEIFRVDAR